MAGIKISNLPVSGAVTGTDIYPAVQTTTTVKQTINQLTTFINNNAVLSSIAQVTGLPAALASFLPLSGGTMTGDLDMGNHFIHNLTDPVNPQDAATMAYVQTFASGITVILAAYAASTANVPSTQAGAGIGATLTDNSGTFAPFSIDGVSPPLNSRILIKDQTASQNNGVYDLTTNGDSISIPWQLTRSTDYDTNTEIVPGTLVPVDNGTANASTSWLETATVSTVDTDPVQFSQFTFAPTAFFQIANNLSEGNPATMRTNLGLTGAATMTLPVSAANGGTGVNNGASTITIGGNLSFSGAFTTNFTITGNTSVTLPTSGTLLTSAQPTINQPNIVGTTTNDNAAAGSVGELISSSVLSGAAVSITSTVSKNITSIALTEGDWDVWGDVFMNGNASTRFVLTTAGINTTSATLPTQAAIDASSARFAGEIGASGYSIGSTGVPFLPLTPCRISIAVPTTVYLIVNSTFSVSTASAFGRILARRVR